MSSLRELAKRLPGAKSVYRRVSPFLSVPTYEPFPRGHFYSPLPDIKEVEANAGELFRSDVGEIAGIDLRADSQIALLKELTATAKGSQFPSHQTSEFRYYGINETFQLGSADFTSAMLLHLQPRRVIEVGSGFSSAMMLDVNDRWMKQPAELTFIEPYPGRLQKLMRPGDLERHRLIAEPVQDVPLTLFDQLEENDVLFLDSSHVAKVGSDLNHLLFHVLPRLKPGVVVHFHDIYWPFEYPKSWITEDRLAWNECYFLRAFLQYNAAFSILFYVQYLRQRHSALMQELYPRFFDDPGSALWLRKTK